MTAYTDRICAALEDCLRARADWDEAPDLHFLYAEGDHMRLSDAEALVPARAWGASDVPTFVLRSLADAFSLAFPPGLLAPPGLVAVAFRFESWSVAVPQSAGEPARKHATALHAERRLEEHPDRVEQRTAWAVTREHGHYMATLDRVTGNVWSGKMPAPEGIVPESLEKIIGAISAGVN